MLCLCLLSACQDELPVFEKAALCGVDRNKVVNLDIPFTTANGMDEVVISRAETDMDMLLSSVLVMVYEAVDPQKPELNKLISSQFFDKPTDNSSASGGWITDGSDRTKGLMRMTCPVGDVYIYMVANWTNTFISFEDGMSENSLKDQNNMPRTQKELLETFVPTWKGNVHTVDGLLPMIATVNNSTGLCKVDSEGKISYFKDGDSQNQIFIGSDMATGLNKDNAFDFKRLMAKLTMRFKTGDKSSTAKFSPMKYTLHNGAVHVSPTTRSTPFYENLLMEVKDSKPNNFNTLTPNEFTIYLPENLEEGPTQQLNKWTERELREKDERGKNKVYDKRSDLAGKPVFKYAPKYGSYIEVTGKFEDPSKNIIAAETRYFIHLGHFGSYDANKEHDYNEFNVKRDHHYIVDVTVNGVDDIIAESKDASEGTDPNLTEKNPAVDGLVYIDGIRAYCDAHYDQVEFEISKKNFTQDFAVIFASTPFGAVSLFYYPADRATREGRLINAVNGQPIKKDEVLKLLHWVEMKKQESKGKLAPYMSTDSRITIFDALDYVWQHKQETYYFTCFVDEYYYKQHPLDPSKELHLRDFVNKPDRSFALGKNIHISKDGSSVSVDAITVVYQKAISTFYDLDKFNLAPYGVESISELGTFDGYGSPASTNYDDWDGRKNTLGEIQNTFNKKVVNWEKNGWMLNGNGTELVDSKKNRLVDPTMIGTGYGAYLDCLAKNRDFNGNGIIDADELRWYTPSLNQLLGIWIGEPALPVSAALYQGDTKNLTDARKLEKGIYASSNGNFRVLWAEQGCSYGSQYNGITGEVRAVRNLGKNPNDYTTAPDLFYKYNRTNRTIEVMLSEIALREFSPHELAPHHERSAINRVYNMIQLADHPYVVEKKSWCEYYEKFCDNWYTKLITSDAKEAKNSAFTVASQYSGGQEPMVGSKVGDWRLPNQRELALMVMAVVDNQGNKGNFQVKEGLDEGAYTVVDDGCYRKTVHLIHSYSPSYNKVIHCRTKFSNCELDGGSYTPFGFMYNVSENKIQAMWREGNDGPLGMHEDGIAGYFCVRDVK